MLEQERPHLIDDGRTLDDEPPAHAVEGLQLELLVTLQRHAPHARAGAGFGDRLLGQLVFNALRSIPSLVAVKPIVGFSGPFPALSVQFDLEVKSITVTDLFDKLSKGFESET